MKQKLRSAALLSLALLLTAAVPLWLPQTASAVSACPYAPLDGTTPSDPNYNDSGSVNIGVKFRVNGAPFVRGVKFYKGVDNTGTHVAHLRKVGGTTDLASATFSGETSSGWQTVNFSSDVQLDDSGGATNYVVWVSMPNGHYAYTASGYQYSGYGDPFTDVAYIPQGQSSVYAYTSDDTVTPTNVSYDNFFVQPIVGDATAPNDHESVTAADATGGPTLEWSAIGYDNNGTTLDAVATKTVITRDDGTSSVVVGEQAGGLSEWDGPIATQVDTTALPGTDYTYTLTNVDACGNESTGATTDEIGTASQSLSNLFSGNPSTLDTGQTTPAVFGMHWQTSTAGKVWGARLYRAANTAPTSGNLQASLWDNNGDLLATAYVPAGNQQSGWIDVRFEEPVDVDANHDYVIGYYSPNGREVYTSGVFSSAVTNGGLSARADGMSTPNGVYATGFGTNSTTFPTSSAGGTWYGVDVDFYIP